MPTLLFYSMCVTLGKSIIFELVFSFVKYSNSILYCHCKDLRVCGCECACVYVCAVLDK